MYMCHYKCGASRRVSPTSYLRGARPIYPDNLRYTWFVAHHHILQTEHVYRLYAHSLSFKLLPPGLPGRTHKPEFQRTLSVLNIAQCAGSGKRAELRSVARRAKFIPPLEAEGFLWLYCKSVGAVQPYYGLPVR